MKEIDNTKPINYFVRIKKFFSFKKPLLKNFWFYFSIVTVSFFLIFIIPIIINELYKKNSGYITLWGASDVLSYYAVILTGLISVSILAFTIYTTKKETNKQIKFQLSQAQYPFYQIDWIRINETNAHFIKNENQKWEYVFKINNNCELINSKDKTIDIHLNNIGNSIALNSSYSVNMFASTLISDYAVNQKEGIILKYDLGKNLQDEYVHKSMIQTQKAHGDATTTYYTRISVNYKNIWDIELKQTIVIELLYVPTKNIINVSINPASTFEMSDI